ncbi:zinc finger, GRF-type [Artemisia annua]|uniref:Zinc finger, GRF-type n=1 Tax=Artemisia annua TaxID=35608 RepID=A0A2U1MNU5_ARTAN|nr:zinc finger, GRF-type [Artemisia annua]
MYMILSQNLSQNYDLSARVQTSLADKLMDNTSANNLQDDFWAMVTCFCGNEAVLCTSWTNTNPGRRFWSFAQSVPNCGFFLWFDPPMCVCSRAIIPGLLTSRNQLQERLNTMAFANRRLKIWLICSWFLFIVNVLHVILYVMYAR